MPHYHSQAKASETLAKELKHTVQNNLNQNTINSIFEELIEKGNTTEIRLSGKSMHPFLKNNDILTAKKALPPQIKIGDIVVTKNMNNLIIHRVAKIIRIKSNTVYMTRGDNNLSYDQPADTSQIIGKVIKAKRGERIINLEKGLYPLMGIMWMNIKKGVSFLYYTLRF